MKIRRIRPQYFPWKVTLRIRYNSDLITPNQIVNLLNLAGSIIGVGEGRPSSLAGRSGSFGCFHVQTFHIQTRKERA